MSGVKGDTLGIFGFGSSAHLVAQIAKIEGGKYLFLPEALNINF